MSHKEEIANRIKVMQAYLDGKEVQFYDYEESMTWITAIKPAFTDEVKWRIKPEPLVVERWAAVYTYGSIPSGLVIFDSEDKAQGLAATANRIIKVRIEEIIE